MIPALRPLRRLRPLSAIGAAALLAGCAVAIIDVDVYKGPLADHERVQVEQMAAMAIAAKPLLIRLRNELVIADVKDAASAEKIRRDIRFNDLYRDGFVCDDRALSYLQNEKAQFVNAVLYLYVDRSAAAKQCQSAEANLAELSSRAFQSFEKGWREHLGNESSKADWGNLKTRLCSQPGAHPRCVNATVTGLAATYEKLLDEREHPGNEAIDVINAYIKVLETNSSSPATEIDALLRNVEAVLRSSNQMRRGEPAESAAVSLLQDPALLERHAGLLFAAHDDRMAFVRLVSLRAQSYVQARNALSELYGLSLKRIIASPKPPPGAEAARHALIALIVAMSDRSKVAAVAQAVQNSAPRYVAERSQFKELLELAAGLFSRRTGGTITDYVDYLQKNLVNSNAALLARALLRADEIIRELSPESLPAASPDDFLRRDLTRAERQFGLSRVPSKGAADSLRAEAGAARPGQASTNLKAALDKDANSASAESVLAGGINATIAVREVLEKAFTQGLAGLDAGRLDDGLETMIESYLKAVDGSLDRRSENAERELRRLQNGLVNFATKLLFVANNERLLARSNASEDDNIRKSVLLLQAVGNSLRIQADELAQRFEHGEKLGRHAAENEVAGVQRALTRFSGGGEYIRTLLDEFTQDASRKAGTQQNEVAIRDAVVKRAEAALKTYREALGLAEGVKPDLDAKPLEITADGKGLKAFKQKVDEAKGTVLRGYIARRGPLDAFALTAGTTTAAEPDYNTGAVDADNLRISTAPAIQKALAPADGSVPKPGNETLNAFKTWLDTEISAFSAETPRQKVFTAARAYLEGAARVKLVSDIDTRVAAQPDPKKVSLDDLFTIIRALLDNRRNEVFQDPIMVAAGRNANSADNAFAAEDRRIEALRKEARDTEAQAEVARRSATQAAGATDDYNNTVNRLGTALTALAPELVSVTPATAYSVVMAKLQAELRDARAKSSANDVEALQDAIRILATRKPPDSAEPKRIATYRAASDQRLFAEPESNAYRPLFSRRESAKDVLDRMIAVLREEHLQAVREGGTDGARARNVAQAIEAAYTHRAGMAYLRPASAYLRSSYTATSLQDNSLGWRNRLTEMGLRSTPLIGSLVENSKEDRKTIDEIDKQFWQNINRVQLTGSGRTNYVLAKDDVGNWYVRGYSADPKDIIKSASGLAKFHLGARLDANLLTADGAPSLQKTDMERLFERHRQAFYDATTAQYTSVATEVGERTTAGSAPSRLAARLSNTPGATAEEKTALSNAVTAADTVLLRARTEMATALPADAADAAKTRGARIVSALRSLQTYGDALSAQIEEAQIAGKASEAATKAIGERERLEAEHRRADDKVKTGGLVGDAQTKAVSDRDEAASRLQAAVADEKTKLAERERAQRVVGAAKRIAAAVVLESLDRFVGERASAVNAFDTAITFIGDAVRPERAAAPAPTPSLPASALP